jgi:hypothetical protein
VSSVAQSQLDLYRTNFLEHGETPKGVFWNDQLTQQLRFDRLTRNLMLPTSGFSIHDVGAGLGDLHAFLNQRGQTHRYGGTELVPEMAESIRRRFPEAEIASDDFLSDANKPDADFLVLSGTLNLCTSDRAEWGEHVRQVMLKMWECARSGIAVNFLTNHSTFASSELFYADPAQMVDFCTRSMARFVALDHAYPLFEFTITVLKPQHVSSAFPDPTLNKYFGR